ncbi:MAG: YesL family protein [Bacilli bacterium]|jgi:uncharacterized membrane protein YesL|nr:YesL family protein [Bacilli bacterium]
MKEKKQKKSFFHARLSFKRDGPFRTYINILIGYIDSVVLMNFFFLAVSLGIITIGPGLAALYDSYEDLAENRSQKRYRGYFRHFKEEFKLGNILVGFLSTAVLAGLSYSFYFFFLNVKNQIWLTIPVVLTVLVVFFLNRFVAYFFLQNARLKLPVSTILHNSFLLSLAYIKNALICDLGFLAFFLVPLMFLEYCIPVLAVLSFSGAALSCEMSLYSVVDKYCLKDPNLDPAEIKEDDPHLRLDLLDQKKTQK